MGSTKQEGQSSTKTNPWAPTIPTLKDLIGQINGQTGNTAITGNESGALDTLTQNAALGNPYAGQTSNLANDLFAGGTDRTGIASGAYGDLQSRLSPYANGQHFGPDGNPALKGYLDTISNDVQNRVNGMFAGAGRDLSGANVGTLARGIAEGTAPVLAQQYNQDVNNQSNAANSLYGAGNSTSGLLNTLDQTALGNRNAGIGVGQQALDANNYGANAMLGVEAQRRNLPLGNIGNLEQLITPLAQLGQQSKTNTSMTTTPPLGMQIVQGASALRAKPLSKSPGGAPIPTGGFPG